MSELRDRTFARWLVTDRDGAARACAGLAQTLTQLSASAADRGRTVATLWAHLRDRPAAMITFRLTEPDTTHRTGLLAVDDEIVAQVQLPIEAPGGPASDRTRCRSPSADAARHRGRSGHRAETGTGRSWRTPTSGLLALHAELADQAEQLTRSGERHRELLETEQAARAAAEAARTAAEAARARLAFLSHVGAVLGASLDHRQVLSRLSTLLVPRFANTYPGLAGDRER